MKSGRYFDCGICGSRFLDDEAGAKACEAQGEPEVPEWIRSRVGQDVAGFGETGVRCDPLRSYRTISRNGKHIIGCEVDLSFYTKARVACDQDHGSPWIDVSWLDPMGGFNFMQYVEEHNFEANVEAWLYWCREYRIEPDPTRATWWKSLGKRRQELFLRLLREKLAGDGFHAIVLAEGQNRSNVAAQLREVADRIERGESPSAAWPAKVIGRPTQFAGETPFVGRWFGVVYDSDDVDPPWALFSHREQAYKFCQLIESGQLDGECWYGADAGVVRCDAALSLWNSLDEDPYEQEIS